MARSVLLIEDDLDVREMLKLVLEFDGFAVTIAGNGQEGLEVLTREGASFDCIILDLMMPVMSGFEFLEVIHRDFAQTHARIPIIVVSASLDRSIDHLISAATHRIAKPIDITDLMNKVHSLLA